VDDPICETIPMRQIQSHTLFPVRTAVMMGINGSA
jgi:hypothetical protein